MTQRLAPFTRRITQRSVIWGLSGGFGIVLVLVGIAGQVAVRDSRAIRRSASGLLQEQLLIARLSHEVQVEENTLTEVLHRLTREPAAIDRTALLRELAEADQSVARFAIDAAATPKAAVWQQLEGSVRSFSTEVRAALDQDIPVSEGVVASLFNRHEEVVDLIHDLLRDSSARLQAADAQITRQSHDMADESALLLGSSLFLAGLCAIGTIQFVRHSIRRIEWQTNEINRVSWHMLQTQEETARRFSHELHDELGQSLAAVRANLTSKATDDLDERRAAGEDDGHQSGLDGILRHQADAHGQGHGQQAGDGACECVALEVFEREDGGLFFLFSNEQVAGEGLFPRTSARMRVCQRSGVWVDEGRFSGVAHFNLD